MIIPQGTGFVGLPTCHRERPADFGRDMVDDGRVDEGRARKAPCWLVSLSDRSHGRICICDLDGRRGLEAACTSQLGD